MLELFGDGLPLLRRLAKQPLEQLARIAFRGERRRRRPE
jgi:hypothetical protein